MSDDGATAQLRRWLQDFAAALAQGDVAAATALFASDCYWRDLVAFSWNIVTREGPQAIGEMLAATAATTAAHGWVVEGEARTGDGLVQGWFDFETAAGRGKGHVRLKDGKAWTLFTALRELRGFEERSGATREKGVEHGAFRNRQTWGDRRAGDAAELGYSRQPFCLIVGGGQGGIGLAARLKRIGVPTLVVDRNRRAGDAWRNRYKSLCLHDPVWYDHLPYLPFPDHWPIYTPKDKMGDWLEAYVSIMELDYWCGAQCKQAQFDAARGQWTVEIERDGQLLTVRPKHLVLATGMSGFPNLPQIPGAETFRGVQHHSSAHPGGAGYAGRRCIVVGSNNSAHDIAADLWEHGAEVTMLQRSPTLVMRQESLERYGRALYSESAVKAGIDTDRADLTVASIPLRLQPQFTRAMVESIKADDAAFYEALRGCGFQLTFGADESGIGPMYLRRGSGYYIDVGGSQLLIDRRVGLRSGVEIVRLDARSAHLSDGSKLEADLIVYATGYGSMNQWATALISPEVGDRVGRCWGLGSNTKYDPGPWEGELRNMWKPTAQPNLWFHGGNLAQSRFYSRALALQLKARLESIPTPVYGAIPVHHPT